MSEPLTTSEGDEDEFVLDESSSPPPAGGEASDAGVLEAGDVVMLDVEGVAVD